ncbi:uncharacterized protein LOC127249568 isoform X2 [Andrographis paniculata]|uniref:uncharacterized protein LOC127249568 isoform X2 n=1 Tax=Andrographis paniculata TaxID=175694 RepID=UPI0021E7CA28|nr:uncharacterized protein LOC127249568 isoform X2 [Andrographis paniculata]
MNNLITSYLNKISELARDHVMKVGVCYGCHQDTYAETYLIHRVGRYNGCNSYLFCAASILLYCTSKICRADVKYHILLPLSNVEEDKHGTEASGFHAVAFLYGSTDDSIDQKNTDVHMESSGFLPQFPVPGDLLHSLPPTEKLHQIIARTALFVSKHGGQSEIILRVKQGDNPTFGFLMPDHQLHPYFRYLVDHPELLNSESAGSPQDDRKETSNDHGISNGVGGALSLLGSVYGSGEEEDAQDSGKSAKDVTQDSNSSGTHIIHQDATKIRSQLNVGKDGSLPRSTVPSIKEKANTVKKNTLVTVSKSGTTKGVERETHLVHADVDKARESAVGVTSNIDPVIPEPPPELKRVIDKLVEFIMRNGKQFEATLIEQDAKYGRFPFLLPLNKYHPYYLKVLETAQESQANGKGLYSGKERKKGSVLKEKDSAFDDMPLESDKKEKFKMVIGKSKKEMQETESKGTQPESGVMVDAEAAAAILEAATRGTKHAGYKLSSSNSSGALFHTNSSEDGNPGNVGNHVSPPTDYAVSKSEHIEIQNESNVAKMLGRKAAVEVANEADSGEAHLTKEQKLKAERLKRAKMFVALLKNGEVPFKTGTSHGSSLEPPEALISMSASKVDVKEREGSIAPADVDRPADSEKLERNYFGDDHAQRHLNRKYRSRPDVEDDDEEDKMDNGNERHRKRDRKSRSRHRDQDHGDSSDDNNDEGRSSEEEDDGRHYKSKRRSLRSQQEDEHDRDGGDKHRKDKNHKRSSKKHQSRKRGSSKQHPEEEDEHDHDEEERKHSRKGHRSSHHSRDKHRHGSKRPSRNRESESNLKNGTSSDEEHRKASGVNKHRKRSRHERNNLEEGEISSRVSEESRGIAVANGHVGGEASAEGTSSRERAPSQPLPESATEVPDDLRVKIRAMLMATRL